MIATLSSKGQLTVPLAVRTSLRLRTGDKVDFVITAPDRVELIPHRQSVTALRGLVHHTGKPLSLDDMDRAIAQGGHT